MTALLSLPRIPRGAAAAGQSIPPAVRLRAGRELARAIELGVVDRQEVATACRSGDAAIAALMTARHALTSPVAISHDATKAEWMPDAAASKATLAWARSLHTAGRLTDAQIKAMPRDNPVADLTRLCLTATTATKLHTTHPAPSTQDPYVMFWVGHTFLDGLSEYPHRSTESDGPEIVVDLIDSPLVMVPKWLQGDDRQALLSAIHALARSDDIGLLCHHQHAPWVLDGWLSERIEDVAAGCEQDADGRPIVTQSVLDELDEEFGFGFEDCESATTVIGDHIAYLRSLSQFTPWPTSGTKMKAWRKQRAGSPVALVVERLIAIARQVKAITPDRNSFQIWSEGDATAVIVLAEPDAELPYLDMGMDRFGQSEMPSVRIAPLHEQQQNPSAFWALHDAVVMVASLITDAANAIASLHDAQADALRCAA